MAGKSASLLTKTQRNRIQDDFSDLDEEQTHRDQQRIRERVRSGLLDFQLLADYPDRQFALMFDDVPDDELRAAIADTTIVLERLREQSAIDRADVIEDVRTHIEESSDLTDDTKTLEGIDLRTAAEIREQTEADLAEQFSPGRWDRRANGLMKMGVSTFSLLVLVYIGGLIWTMSTTMSTGTSAPIPPPFPFWGPTLLLLFLLLFGSAVGWVLITTAQSLKYNIFPFVVELATQPTAAMRRAYTKLVRNPRKTVRESWEEL